MSNTEENLAAVERELAADVAMAEGRADAEDAVLPEPAADFIYLDYAATAPLCAEAAGAMAPFQVPGPANLAVNANANALYGVGRAAFDLLESARRRAARALGARRPDEIVFTSGATEADDAAVLGLVQAAAEQRRLAGQKDRPLHVVTSAIEHDAVLAPCRRSEGRRARSPTCPNRQGFIEASSLAEAPTDDTVLVSVQAANSEVGAIQPIRELAALAHERGALFHTDAVQALGKMPLDVQKLGVDAASFSAHKIGGPKGVGALYLKARTPFAPYLLGGGQESGRRSGTQNVAGVTGFVAALEAAQEAEPEESARLARPARPPLRGSGRHRRHPAHRGGGRGQRGLPPQHRPRPGRRVGERDHGTALRPARHLRRRRQRLLQPFPGAEPRPEGHGHHRRRVLQRPAHLHGKIHHRGRHSGLREGIKEGTKLVRHSYS